MNDNLRQSISSNISNISNISRKSTAESEIFPSKDKKEQKRIDSIMLNSQGNSKIGEILNKLKPIFDFIALIINIIVPVIVFIITSILKIINLIPSDFIYAFTGLVIAFFGGIFSVTLSAVEAFYESAYDIVTKNGTYIYREFKLLKYKSNEQEKKIMEKESISFSSRNSMRQSTSKDRDTRQVNLNTEESVNDNNNNDLKGTNTEGEIQVSSPVTQKISFFFANCGNPVMFMDMLYGIANAFFAVVAVLKVDIAKNIALGISIGENIRKPAAYYLAPILGTILNTKYHKWIAALINLICKSIAIIFAIFLEEAVSMVQTSIRGGLMFSRSILHFLNKMKIIKFREDDTYLDEYLGWAVASLGLYFQITNSFGLPFPFSIILYPITLFESALIWLISE